MPSAVGQHGEYAAVAVWRLGDVEFLQYPVNVGFDGSGREVEPGGDGRVGVALGHRGEDLALAFGERVQRVGIAFLAEKLLDDGGVDDAFALGDALERVDEDRDVRDASLSR